MTRISFNSRKFKKSPPLSERSKLIEFIIKKRGGPKEVMSQLKISKQLLSIWKKKGYVPLHQIGRVANLLNVSPLALNFIEFSRLTGSEETWEKVYKDCLESLS